VDRGVEIQSEQAQDRTQRALGLPPWPLERQAQHQPGFDRDVGIVLLPAALAVDLRRVPGFDRLGRDPHRQVAAPAQRLVVLPPVVELVLDLRDLVTARFGELGGHSGSRGKGPVL